MKLTLIILKMKKYFLIIILIITLLFSPVNLTSLFIDRPEFKKNKPITESAQSFHNLNIYVQFIIPDKPPSEYAKKISVMKKQIKDACRIIQSLIYTKNPNSVITLTPHVIGRFKPYIKNASIKDLKNQSFFADLLLLVNFCLLKNQRTSIIFYRKHDEDDLFLKVRTVYALLKVSLKTDIFNERFEDDFKLEVIHQILVILGFRADFLKKKWVRNNFNTVPFYLVKDSLVFKSYKKYLNFTNQNLERNEAIDNGTFYQDEWPFNLKINDIMKVSIHPDTSITELTLSVFNSLDIYSTDICDIFKYEAGFGKGFSCLRPQQDCISYEKSSSNYFIRYGYYNDFEVKCYLSTKENILNKQCGVLYGNPTYLNIEYEFCPVFKPIKPEALISTTPIPELDLYQNRTIRLIRNSKTCPKNSPRVMFFSVPHSIFDEFKSNPHIQDVINAIDNINKNVEYDEIVLTDKKYFVTFETYDEYYTRVSVLRVLQHSGAIRSYDHLNTHNFLIKNPGRLELEEMGYIPIYQKMFSIKNWKIIANKDLSYKNYYAMKLKFPKDYNYMPESYSYPEQKDIIKKKFKKYKFSKYDLWLIKPKTGSLGQGIYIFEDLEHTPADMYLITKYISFPHLIKKRKYDFRLYVLFTGLAPLRMYLYKEGMIRFATEDYSLDMKDIKDIYRHLTNISLNKKNKAFVKANDADTEEGSKWSLQVYEHYCKENGIDYKHIRDQMADIAIKSVLSVENELLKKIRDDGTDDQNHMKLFGYDFMVDKDFKVYLIEINDRPSLIMGDINDYKLKPQLVADTMNLLGIVPYSHDYKDNFKTYDEDNADSIPETEKAVNNAICELGRPRGRYDLIFPLKSNINYYKQFYKVKHEENELL